MSDVYEMTDEQLAECSFELEHAEMTECEVPYDTKELDLGIKSVSYLVGQIIALQQADLTNEDVIKLLTLQETIKSEEKAQAHEAEMVRINAKMQVEIEEIKARTFEIGELLGDN